MSEAHVQSAEVTKESSRGPWVRLTLTEQGSQKVLKMTRSSIGNQLGVVLNGRLVSTPIIQAPISNGIPITRISRSKKRKMWRRHSTVRRPADQYLVARGSNLIYYGNARN